MTDQLVKRFVAPTMTRALELVQRELGPEAVILSSKRIDKGVEIITSLEPDLPTRGIDVRREFGQKFDAELDTALPSDSAWRSQAGIEKAAASYGGQTEFNGGGQPPSPKPPSELAKEIEAAREKMLAAKRQARIEAEGGRAAISQPAPSQSLSPQASEATSFSEVMQTPLGLVHTPEKDAATSGVAYIDQLKDEIADMRLLLEQQIWQNSERYSVHGRDESKFSLPQQVNMPQQFTVISDRMRRLGLSDEMSESLMSEMPKSGHVSEVWRSCMVSLAKRLPIRRDSVLNSPGVYAFLGQTGVGKTTTIAKLAAQYVLRHGPGKVALVTTDTYRVGAFDQLRTMGKILNVPVRVVDRDNSLLTVLASLRQFPLVLIDTAGFRLGDPLLKSQLEQLESSPVIKRVLVLSCNNQLATMKASLHAHRGARGLHACVLTKLDESASIGEALSLVAQENVPVAYSTAGQDIPNDISEATGQNLVAKAVSIVKEQSLEARAAI